MLRMAKVMEAGAENYGRFNYMKGMPIADTIDSLGRHYAKYLDGWDDEDHLAMIAVNSIMAMETESKHPEMIDHPHRIGKNTFPYKQEQRPKTVAIEVGDAMQRVAELGVDERSLGKFVDVMTSPSADPSHRDYKIIAVDFDGCLCRNAWPEIGEPNNVIIDLLINWRRDGYAKVILWTCREGQRLDEAVAWCKAHGLEFDAVNANLPEMNAFYGNDSRKIGADQYWDDKAVKVIAGGDGE